MGRKKKSNKGSSSGDKRINIVISFILLILVAILAKGNKDTNAFSEIKDAVTGFADDIISEVKIEYEDQNSENTVDVNSEQLENQNEIKTENLQVYFIDVGQADSILIMNKEQSMLIDAGNNDDGKTVVDFIKSKGITKLNYIVGTHPHEDHIGGLDDVINSFDIENVFLPDITTTTKTFEDVITALENKKLTITCPAIGDKFKIGEANCEIMTSIIDKENLNLSSLAIRLEYGKNSFLLMGDAETKNEKERNWEKVDVLKVGHHGSTSSTSATFLTQVKPQYAIICVGKDNDYGHPKDTILKRLKSNGAEIYRTDLNGTITIISDGKKLKISCEKNFQ